MKTHANLVPFQFAFSIFVGIGVKLLTKKNNYEELD